VPVMASLTPRAASTRCAVNPSDCSASLTKLDVRFNDIGSEGEKAH
jgi:hypothetical protein